jgi:AcrR family transcriptional regulator
MTAPYLRIAGEIRERIRAEQLRPGDRVPSAREITREWSVAIATATKVLATLGAEGLTEVVPGKGTLVARPAAASPAAPPPKERPAPQAEPVLGRDRIVRTAIAIADADGLAEVSMRRVATALDVATMSLYRHVGSKDELIVHMIDAAVAEEPLPPPGPNWRAELEAIGRLQWTVYRRHTWVAPAMSLTRPQLAPHAVALADRVLLALAETGLSLSEQLYVHLTLFSYIRGVASALEPEAQAQQETGLTYDEWMQTQESALEAALPASSPLRQMTEQGDSDFDLDLDRLFEFGLTRLLDGIVAGVAGIRR